MSRNYTALKKGTYLNDNMSNTHIKTTDVNILLNRVRLDKKKTFKKKLLSSLMLIGLVCMITFFFIS